MKKRVDVVNSYTNIPVMNFETSITNYLNDYCLMLIELLVCSLFLISYM